MFFLSISNVNSKNKNLLHFQKTTQGCPDDFGHDTA